MKKDAFTKKKSNKQFSEGFQSFIISLNEMKQKGENWWTDKQKKNQWTYCR